MYDFHDMIGRALAAVGAKDPIVAMPYARPRQVIARLLEAGDIAGFIGDDIEDASCDPHAVGWWRDRARGDICFAKGRPSTLVYVGLQSGYRIPWRLLLHTLIPAPKMRIAIVDPFGQVIEDTAIHRPTIKRLMGAASATFRDFESGLDSIFEDVGDELRLPYDSFDPKRILFFIGSLAAGGAERQASYLAAQLARNTDYDVHIACYGLDPPNDFFLAETRAAGVHVFEMPRQVPELFGPRVLEAMKHAESEFHALACHTLLREIVQTASAIREVRPAIVHTWMDYYNSLAGIAATLTGVPKLICSGRSVSPQHFQIFQPFMKPGYQAVLARRAVTILNNSNAGARDYERWLGLGANSIETIHNGFELPLVDKAALRAAQRRELGLGNANILAGSVLRFSEEKRPEFLLAAAAEMLRRNSHLRFVFFGEGPLRETLLDEAEALGLSEVVLMPGRTADVWKALAAMDVFMLASRMEGLPNVLIEAQLMGVPVICTGVGGMSETFKPNITGVVAPGDSPARFADVAIALLSDPSRLAQLSAAAAEFSRCEFSMRGMCDRMISAYERAAPT